MHSVDELMAQLEQMQIKLDLANTELDKALNKIIPPSTNIHFKIAHYGHEDEDEIEAQLVEEIPPFVEFIRYNVDSMRSLSEQWGVKDIYNTLNNKEKRLFYHFYLMACESENLPVDKDSNLMFSWAEQLNMFIRLAKSFETVGSGCWLVKENVTRSISGCPMIGSHVTRTNLARYVCLLNYGSLALKDMQASHLCDNSECGNPLHIFPETATANLKRDECFKVGYALSCECIPKCLFMRDGQELVCRSNPNLTECEREYDCFLEVDNELLRRARKARKRQRNVEPTFNIRPIAEAQYGQNRNGNRCLIIDGLNFAPRRVYESKYTILRNLRNINGRRATTHAYSDANCFFITNE
ncbi:hypothetical protein M3Y97_00745800 [Aphelenchoides bicaudatus]|nr:hypothetical protein M3Y97_00745800 [Aphelenchoides bicaudatus]